MKEEIRIHTDSKEEFIDITTEINQWLSSKDIQDGIMQLFVPHTTAAVTINENADPHVVSDILKGLSTIVPEKGFRHSEGNSPAHIKSSMIGVSLSVIIENGRLQLGTWQGIYFCEFDGPRDRKIWIQGIKQK